MEGCTRLLHCFISTGDAVKGHRFQGRGCGSEGKVGRTGGDFQFCENIPGQDRKPQGLGFQKGIDSAAGSLSPPPAQPSAPQQFDRGPVGKPTLWAIGLGHFAAA